MKIKKWIYLINIVVSTVACVVLFSYSNDFYLKGIVEKGILREKFFICILASIGVSILASKLIIFKAVKPIEDLKYATNAFSKGQNIRVRRSKNDEITLLVDSFNQMKKEVEEKREAIDREHRAREYMIASISHDLKTPVTSIRLYAELLDNSTKKEEREKYIKLILDKCDYIKEMLNSLLVYTVLESGYKKDLIEVKGEEFFEMLFENYSTVCSAKGIKYLNIIDCKGIYKVNVNEITRVVDNLMDNAIKYTEKGNRIFTGVFSYENRLPYWIDKQCRDKISEVIELGSVIVIKNEGEVIKQEDKKKIFKAFYKNDNSRESNGGAGIGLSVVKLIIEQHGGLVEVFPIEGVGNIFVCFLKQVKN